MISIIMIVYEVEDYVEEAIRSVLAQTYEDFELIIVVGYGSDRSEEICRAYAAKDTRIKLICCEARGIADARNRGMEAVTGDYLGFVDSDDYIEPGMYARMIENIKKYDADIAVCGRFYEYVATTLSDTPKDPEVMTGEEALAVTLGHDGFFLHCWDKLFTKKIFEGLTFRTDITVEDRIVVDRLLSKAGSVVYDPTPMYHFRERYGSNSKRSGMVRKNVQANLLMEEFLKKEHPALSDKCDRFMLYEFITALQNEATCDHPDRNDIKEYKEKVKHYLGSAGSVPKSLRVKAVLALYALPVLATYTKLKKKRSNMPERFP